MRIAILVTMIWIGAAFGQDQLLGRMLMNETNGSPIDCRSVGSEDAVCFSVALEQAATQALLDVVVNAREWVTPAGPWIPLSLSVVRYLTHEGYQYAVSVMPRTASQGGALVLVDPSEPEALTSSPTSLEQEIARQIGRSFGGRGVNCPGEATQRVGCFLLPIQIEEAHALIDGASTLPAGLTVSGVWNHEVDTQGETYERAYRRNDTLYLMMLMVRHEEHGATLGVVLWLDGPSNAP